MKRISALHIGKFYPPSAGGIENFLADLLSALKRHDVEVMALVHEDPDIQSPAPDANVAEDVERVPCYGRLLYAPISPGFPWALRRLIRKIKPDVLHLHMPNTSAMAALILPCARKIPWIVHWHADVVPSRIDGRMGSAYRFYRPLEQRLLARAAAVIVTSDRYLNSSEPLLRWRKKCEVVPLGIDADRLPEPDRLPVESAESIWGDADFRILAIGRLTYYKGHEVLIKAVAAIDGLKAVIVGAGDQRARLEKLVEGLGLQDRVVFPGFLDDDLLHALIATCHCLCLPSIERTEAFGLVLLEAMRYGKPVVASDVAGSGIGWVVQDDETGVLVRPGDVSELVCALQDLADDSVLRQRLGNGGRERFWNMFHIDPVAVRTKALYERIVNLP